MTQFGFVIFSLLTVIILGLWLTIQNYKELIRTKDQRIAARKRQKKEKNARLKAAFEIYLANKDRNDKN